MNNIFGYKLSDLEQYFYKLDEKKFKARQIYEWIYKKNIYDFKLMTNIKRELQEKLSEDFNFDFISIEKKQTSNLTNKYLSTRKLK